MTLVEKHIVTKSSSNFKAIDEMCFLSKNLYNQANFLIRQSYFEGKRLSYYEVEEILRKKVYEQEDFDNYHALPNNTSQQVLMVLDKNWKSYLELKKVWEHTPHKLLGEPRIPKYKDKESGRNLLVFTSNQFKPKGDKIHFPKKTNIEPITTKIKEGIKQVRIIPRLGHYVIEVVYEKEVKELSTSNSIIGIDLGMSNLCAIVSNQPGLQPILINGRKIKSTNEYFNKEKANLQSQLPKGQLTSHRIRQLLTKRSNQINGYFHKITHFIIQYCLDNNIGSIVVGSNIHWKQGIKLGKKTNRRFVQIPFDKLKRQLEYKCQLNGINYIETEESYTSKIDHFANESMEHHPSYLGKRIKRGLFKSSTGRLINADVNGAIGIMRKHYDTSDISEDELISTLLSNGFVHNPSQVNLV